MGKSKEALPCLGTKPCRLGKLSSNPRFFILSGNSANGNCLNRTFVEMPIYLFDSISTLLNISIGAVEGELGRSVSVWKNEKLEDGMCAHLLPIRVGRPV